MNPTLVIAHLTFREAIRRRIAIAALALGLAFVLIYNVGVYFILQEVAPNTGMNEVRASVEMREGINFLFQAGLYAVNFLSLAMAALLAADTLAGEIGSGSIQTLAAKPLSRWQIVVGKWLGFAGMLALYQALMMGSIVLSMFIQGRYIPDGLSAGLPLIYLNSVLVMSVTLLLSSRLSSLATGGIVFGLYGLAFIGGWVEQIGAILDNQTAVQIGILSSLISPSEALWRRAAYEMQTPLAAVLRMSPFAAISVPSPAMVVYSLLYIGMALLLAVQIFKRRDL